MNALDRPSSYNFNFKIELLAALGSTTVRPSSYNFNFKIELLAALGSTTVRFPSWKCSVSTNV